MNGRGAFAACAVATCALVSALFVRRADACNNLPCAPARAAPPDGATIPENARALWWSGAQSGDGTRTLGAREARLALANAAGTAIAVTTEAMGAGFVVRPAAPFVAGATYVLSWDELCSAGSPFVARRTFTVGPSAPLPSTLGSIDVETRGRAPRDIQVGSCAKRFDVTLAHLRYEPSSAMRPWLSLARFESLVDGSPWASTSFGDPAEGRTFDVFAACGGDTRFAPLGRHDVVVRAAIVGEPSAPAPLSSRVPLACDRACGCRAPGRVTSFADPSALALATACMAWYVRRRRDPAALRATARRAHPTRT